MCFGPDLCRPLIVEEAAKVEARIKNTLELLRKDLEETKRQIKEIHTIVSVKKI